MTYQAGSIIKRRLGGMSGLLFHHMGVYIDADTVIHLNGEKQKTRNAILRRQTLAEFAAGRRVQLHAEPRNAAHAQAICDEALRLHLESSNGYNNQYDFVFNNCEDFCVACFEVMYSH